MKVFTYGTLLPGMPLNTMIAGARRLGPALAEGRLLSLPPYCGLVSGNGRVTGELFELDGQILDKLDRVEGFDPGDPRASLYLRKGVSVQRFSDGSRLDAETGGRPAWVVAYGSNISSSRLCRRLPSLAVRLKDDREACVRKGWLQGFALAFTKWSSTYKRSRANIEFVCGDARCPAVAWLLTQDERRTLDAAEGGYCRIGMPMDRNHDTLLAQLYIAGPAGLCQPELPEKEYLDYIRDGYREYGLDTAALEEAMLRAKEDRHTPR